MKQPSVPAEEKRDSCPWAMSGEELLRELRVESALGLAETEARSRLGLYGQNQLQAMPRRTVWSMLLDQVKSVVVVMLIAAAALSMAFGDTVEGLAILAVVLINAAIGFATERHAVRSMEALRKLGRVDTLVRRDGRIVRLPAEQLVPGDVVLLEGGDVVTADLRVIESSRLQADESTLTGESVPVAKRPLILPAQTPLAERSNMLFKGSAITLKTISWIAMIFGTEISEDES